MVARRSVIVHPDDNVATLVDERTDLAMLAGGTVVEEGIPYGHKVAIRAIGAGEEIVKYGVVIGVASVSIASGCHVHVHNVCEPGNPR